MAIEKNNVVVVEHVFGAPAPRVFAALKEGRLFFNCGAWPDGTEVDFRVGGKYRVHWGHHGTTYGEFTEIVENRRVAFTWVVDEMDVKSSVVIELVSQGSGCKATLRHEGFQNREIAEAHEGGWTKGLSGFGDELTGGRVKLDREFLVPVEMLYEACVGMNLFSNFGAAEVQVDFKVGGAYRIRTEKGCDIHGKFLEIEKNKKIVFSFEGTPCGAPLGDASTTVSMEFGPWGDGGKNSYLELIHEGFPTHESAREHHTGWNEILRKIYNKASR